MTEPTRLPLPQRMALDPRRPESALVAQSYLRFRYELVINRTFYVNGLRVAVTDNGRAMEPNTAYWHIVTVEQGVLGRQFCVERAACIPYIRPLLEAVGTEAVAAWHNQRSTAKGVEKNITVSPLDFGFIVVLRLTTSGSGLLLWTAYPIQSERQRGRLAAEYRKAHKKIGGA